MLLVYIFIVVIVFVAFFYLFVCVDGNKQGVLATIKRFLFEALPSGLAKCGRATCGNYFVDTI